LTFIIFLIISLSLEYNGKGRKGKGNGKMCGIVSLRRLSPGQKAVVVDIQAEGELGRRIRDMGLIPGAELRVVGRAPLKDPVALRLAGFTLSLRNDEASHINVRPLQA
jgi:ferrous iron transport protein A